jgi:predicted transcriptional regulator
MKKSKAKSLINTRIQYGPHAFAELAVWEPPVIVIGSKHKYKYRLAYVVHRCCVLRYDNEARKGDHRHYGALQRPYHFISIRQLIQDFLADIARWNHENGEN